MNSRLALGIITYKPGQNLIARLGATLQAGYSIYLFDNSPEDDSARKLAGENATKIVYMTCGKNAGLGFALASICARAYYDGCQVLLFFDQDTVFTSDTLDFIRGFYEQHTELQKEYSAVVFNSKNTPMAERGGLALNTVLLTVNSGSLYFLENLRRLNWHNINYFVDCVDYEFCLSSYNNGFKIGEYTKTPGFDHSAEQADSIYKFFGTERPMRAYPLSRVCDSIFATLKLLIKSALTGNYIFFYEIGKVTSKYLIVQAYVRIVSAIKFLKLAHGK
jgi:rhamnosyltransferase